METQKNEVKEVQKELEREISQMEEKIKELPAIKKDARKSFLILGSTVLIAVLMKNVLELEGWWLLVISILNVISLMATVIFIVVSAKWYYLTGIAELIEKAKEKEKK